ncbi:MAG: hypothetical protein K0M45_03670, partial [Candidatus Paracaedibacteraceae bacterium]|nr:hypothetical protein [Candidatus Paracaedibacteraceae bacterium]
IIIIIDSIPDSETIIEVANHALELFNVNPYYVSMIIESLASIPDSETRREVVEQASKLFTEDIDEVSQFQIILALASIPDSETRRDIVKQTLKLFTKNMSGHGRSQIIKTLSTVIKNSISNEYCQPILDLLRDEKTLQQDLWLKDITIYALRQQSIRVRFSSIFDYSSGA